jgi:predicted metal-dependent hydrolase
MTLRVAPGGVRLTVPARTPASRIEAFLLASAGWVDEQRSRLPPAPPRLAGGDRLAHLDDTLRLVVAGRSGRRAAVVRDGTTLVVAAPDGDGLDALVERWYRAEARRIIAPRAQARAAALGASVARVAIRDPRSRWGSCSTSGTLSFSWRLVLAPERILDYVVAHEACHLRRPDHSPAFWELLEEAFPGHATARRWLRDNGALLHLGPAWRPDGGLSPA